MNPATAAEHIIRLRGPWTFLIESGQPTENVRQPFTKPLPESWRQEPGAIVAKRKFNSPSGLSPVEVVCLVIHRRGTLDHVLLNDEPLPIEDPAANPLSWNITRLLVPFNELRIAFRGAALDAAQSSPPIAQVELRISTVATQGPT